MQILRMFSSGLRCAAALFLLVSGAPLFAQSPSASRVGEAAIPISADYVLRPSDLLQVKVFNEDNLTREVSISGEYTIHLPLIGTVDVRGRTVRQLEEIIRQLYDRDFLVNPQVTLIVLRYAERSVNVIGSVNAPQAVPFPPERGLTLLEAIARAGGFSRLADKKRVQITRTDANGASNTFTINAEHLISGKSPNSWPLQVNDVIFVPEGFL
jgi:protein involved in polysaccharide export with SLBB domain